MSDETWADLILADSALPDDDFTFTDGSNYGLDGFDFDQEMNEGVLDGARLPEVKGLSHLPDGFVPDVPVRSAADDISMEDLEDGIDLSAFLAETDIEGVDTLTDLDWLDPTQDQDPDRLPVNPVDRSLGELWDAWGVNRRTDGIHLLPDNKDLEIAEYEVSLKEGPQSGLPGNERREEIKDTIRWAMRQSAIGRPMIEIKRSVLARLGHDAKLTRAAVQRIEDEHGLAGRVFLHSVAYPQIHQAKYAKLIKKQLRGLQAHYVVVPDGEQRLAVWESLGKKLVAAVPWKAALRYYRPRLVAAGYKLASKGDPRSRLKRAFLAGVEEVSPEPSNKPLDVRPADRVDSVTARKAFRVAEAPPRQLIDLTDRQAEDQRRKALVQVALWTKAGRLTLKEAHRLGRSTVAPEMLLRTATMLVQAASGPKTRVYDGTGETNYKRRTAAVSKRAAWRQLKAAETEQEREDEELEKGRREKLGAKLGGMVAKGLLTKKEAIRLAAMDKPVVEILKLAAAAAQHPHLRPAEVPQSREAREYEGPVVGIAPQHTREAQDFDPETKRILAAAKVSGIKAGEFRGLLKWARIKMTGGAAGDELDQLLKFRFSRPLLKAAKKLLKAVRKEHEGLAGHLYIDAGAYTYGTKRGTKGCDQGALEHRANQLKVVLAMGRCSSCVAQSSDGVCSKYNKPLVAGVPIDNPAEYQRQAIKMANAPDAEVTAALFAPTYDQGEYALVDPLADISIDEAVDTEELGEILFGGMEL